MSFRNSTPSRPVGPPAAGSAPGSAAGGRRVDLDVVRAVAILLAMGWHFNHGDSGNAVLDALQEPGRTFGWAGVDLFFVLSGFLVGRLVLREHQRTGRFDGWRFSARRAMKLWPVLYVFLAVSVFAGSDPWQSFFWQTALHVQNYAGTSLSHLWSLAVEEHFYLALAVLFPLFARRRVRPVVLAGVLTALLVAALALRWGGVLAGENDLQIQWRTHFRMDALAAGVLLATVSMHWPRAFDRLLGVRWLTAGLTAAGLCWLATLGKNGAVGETFGYTVSYLTAAAFLLTVYRASWVPRTGWAGRGLAAVGRHSYGIYIWHLLAARLVTGWLPGMGFDSHTPAAQLAKYASAVTVGIGMTLVVERPMLALRDRLFPARAAAGAPPGSPRTYEAVVREPVAA